MNPKLIVALVVVCCSFSIVASAEEDASFPILKGPYLGQKAPGMVPEVFAPGFISTEQFEFGIAFSRDGRECFFTRRPTTEGSDNRIYHSRWAGGRWSPPARASFAGDVFEFLPVFSVNSEQLFFYSERPKPQDAILDGNLWVAGKSGSGWGEARFFQAPANRAYCMTVSEAKNGTIYFSGIFAGKRGMFRAARRAGEYGELERLPEEINAIRPAHPFIAPDESYLIMDAQVAGMGQPELFISFRNSDGSWTRALNMGDSINATKTEFAASVSPDGKFLFFHRRVNGNGDIYWVDAGIIDELREKSGVPFISLEDKMIKQHFQAKINAAKEKVWATMLNKDTYEKWTKAFSPNSTFAGDWSEGSAMRFWDPGYGGGTKALLEKVVPFELVRMRHVAMIAADGSEDVESPEAKKLVGTLEPYRFSESKGVSRLIVDIEAHEDYAAMFVDGWNKALLLLQELCEANP